MRVLILLTLVATHTEAINTKNRALVQTEANFPFFDQLINGSKKVFDHISNGF